LPFTALPAGSTIKLVAWQHLDEGQQVGLIILNRLPPPPSTHTHSGEELDALYASIYY
jgi:hypothetical protein